MYYIYIEFIYMISRTQIDYILALLEHKNFQRAADACFVTQPTLSMQLKKAEEQLGHAIFDRDKQPVELTPFGQRLLPHLYQITDSFSALSQEIKKSTGKYKAQITVGIIPTIAIYLVPEMYREWQSKLDGIRLQLLELKTEKIIEALEHRKIDMGIMAGPLTIDQLSSQILFNEEIRLFAPHLRQHDITIEELAAHKPWLLSQGNCLRNQMVNFCKLHDQSQDEWNYEGGSIDLLIQMVRQEGGYTLVPDEYCKTLQLDLGDFVRIKNHTPARQIISVFNHRNSKEKEITAITHTIQHAKSKDSLSPTYAEILSWK